MELGKAAVFGMATWLLTWSGAGGALTNYSTRFYEQNKRYFNIETYILTHFENYFWNIIEWIFLEKKENPICGLIEPF